VIFSLITAGVYYLTGFEWLLILILLQHVEILHQFLPFLRLDGTTSSATSPECPTCSRASGRRCGA
jgi:hypothetical protein